MKKSYLIQQINSEKFWSSKHRRFTNYSYADSFRSEETALWCAKEDNVGIFKITEIYDTREYEK